MKKWLVLTLLLLLIPWPALADQVQCESVRNGRTECDMDTRGVVRLVQQLSKTRCVEGSNWGYFKHSIWVDNGCRGIFVSGGGTPGSGNGSNPQYHSPSQLQGNNDGSYYPDNLPTQVTCESKRNQRTECGMDTRGEIRLVQRLSKSPCQDGVSWGYSRHSIWVDRGCRAVFESDGGPSHASGPGEPRSEQIAACNAVEDWYGKVVSYSALKPGAFEIILDYGNRGRYVCNVERNLDVTYFERLRKQ